MGEKSSISLESRLVFSHTIFTLGFFVPLTSISCLLFRGPYSEQANDYQ